MDLGKGKLRRNGVNTLVSALHDRHGLVWTNGRCVFLSPIHVDDDEVENTEAFRLGEFDFVQSLHWSSEIAGGVCYLCVVHQTTVSIWRVSGGAPDLNLKQVRKINATPISEGVLWSPNRDILCILNKDQASFYFKHSQNKGSFALPPIESGKITAGCWSMDGNRLLIGIGSIILIYLWDDIDKSISEYTIIAWKIPNVDGQVSSLIALTDHQMACTAELPLESLCHAVNSDTFTVPEVGHDANSGEQNDLNSSERKGEEDLIKASLNTDNTSHKDTLFNLQQAQGPAQASSQLIVFDMHKKSEPCKLSSANIKGVLAPDLICYHPDSKRIVVGSNNQSTLQVFSYSEELTKLHDIRLRRNERPKGVGVLRGENPLLVEGAFIMVGRPRTTDATFLPTTNRELYDLSLHFYPFQFPAYEQCLSGGSMLSTVPLDSYTTAGIFKELQLPSRNAKVHLLRINPIRSEDKGRDRAPGGSELSTSASSSPVAPNGKWKLRRNVSQKVDLVLPGETASAEGRGMKSGSPRGKVILLEGSDLHSNRELEIERVSFSDHAPQFFNSLETLTSKSSASKDSDVKNSPEFTDDFPANIANKFGLNRLMGQKVHSLPRYDWNGEYPDSIKGFREEDSIQHPSIQSDTLSEHIDFAYHDLPQQVATLESEMKTQGRQITTLQDRIDHISKLLEETSLVSSTAYHTASNPEVVYLVLHGHDGEPDVKKAFVLDGRRLQLEPVKQTFSLLTVELLLDGEPCVLGANMDGYIPIKFSPNDVMYITGRPTADTLKRDTIYSSSTI